MPFEVLDRILDDLQGFGFSGEIHPALFGEPTMDKRLPEIIQRMRARSHRWFIKLYTNGDGLKEAADVDRLIKAGVNQIYMNHYNDRLAKIKTMPDRTFPHIIHFGMKSLLPTFNNRAGKVNYEPEEKKKHCYLFLHKLMFTYTGDMVLCCNDFDSEVVFGNIMEKTIPETMQSKLYQTYQQAHEKRTAGKLPLCRDCNYIEDQT